MFFLNIYWMAHLVVSLRASNFELCTTLCNEHLLRSLYRQHRPFQHPAALHDDVRFRMSMRLCAAFRNVSVSTRPSSTDRGIHRAFHPRARRYRPPLLAPGHAGYRLSLRDHLLSRLRSELRGFSTGWSSDSKWPISHARLLHRTAQPVEIQITASYKCMGILRSVVKTVPLTH